MLIELGNEKIFKKENLNSWEKNTSFWLRHHLMDRKVENLLVHDIGKLCSYADAKTIVDLGCGNGWLLQILRRKNIPFSKYVGMDYNHKFIDHLRGVHHGNIATFECLDIEKILPGSLSKSADIVVSCLSMIETPNLEKVFRNISQIIAPKGNLIIVSLNPEVEIYRDSKTQNEFEANYNFYSRKKEKTVISKKISNNRNTSENDYFRILYSVDSYVKAARKHGLKLLDFDKINDADKKGSIKPSYEFIRFTK